MERYPPWEKIRSPTELKEKYESARAEINNYKRTTKIANVTSRQLAQDKEKLKKEAKITGKQVLTLTKKKKD